MSDTEKKAAHLPAMKARKNLNKHAVFQCISDNNCDGKADLMKDQANVSRKHFI